ncbi:hypothetical protein [Dyadobacter alkalitolerans]|uniref:hypothetical protein n=1 Tax=Dyadobacter alkalitolerans TaxID=492736 RepID=UPI0003F6B8BF|nr:hypothetical protein [Dyadobacter alkalitolerans]
MPVAAPILLPILTALVETAKVAAGLIMAAALDEKLNEIDKEIEKLKSTAPNAIQACSEKLSEIDKQIKDKDQSIQAIKEFEQREKMKRKEKADIEADIEKLEKDINGRLNEEGQAKYREKKHELSKLYEKKGQVEKEIESARNRRKIIEDRFGTLDKLQNSKRDLNSAKAREIARSKQIENDQLGEQLMKEELAKVRRESGLEKTVGKGDKNGFPQIEKDVNGDVIGIKYPKNPPKPEP